MDTITKQLADALRDLQYATLMRPSCQAGHALRCLCSGCAEVRANKALAAYDAQPHHMPEARKMVQQARQPLTQVSIEKLFCDRIDIRADEYIEADTDTYRRGQWFRRGWQAAQDYFGITGEQP